MTNAEIQAVVLGALSRIAPEVAAASLKPDVRLRDQIDMDSMDFLNFMLELHASLGVDVPEADYPKLATLDGCVAYLAALVGNAQPAGGAKMR
jgi:acyl carrier protein